MYSRVWSTGTLNRKTNAEEKYGTQHENKSLKRPRSSDTNNDNNNNKVKQLQRALEKHKRQKKNAYNEECAKLKGNCRNQRTIPTNNNIRTAVGLQHGQDKYINNKIRDALKLNNEKITIENWTKLSEEQKKRVIKDVKQLLKNELSNQELISAYVTFKTQSQYFDDEFFRLQEKKGKRNLNRFRKPSENEIKIISKIHELVFKNPNLIHRLPQHLVPMLTFYYSNAINEFGHLKHHPNHSRWNPSAIFTITKELKADKERWLQTVRRLQAAIGSSKIKGGQEKPIGNKILGSSGGIRLFKGNTRKFNRHLKKSEKQVRLYHTVELSKLKHVDFEKIKELHKSSIGIFGQSFWHTDAMFQWVGKGSLRNVKESGPSPKVGALFTMYAPQSVYEKWTRSTINFNKNATGTGTTLLVEPFVFRVEKVKTNINEPAWDAPYHFHIQWLSNKIENTKGSAT